MRTLISAILLSLFLGACLCDVPISEFEGHPFSVKPPSAMYQLAGLNLESIASGSQIVAYGDFNNDKYTDIVTLTDDRKTLSVLLYSHGSFSFAPLMDLTFTDPIDSVIPGDYNYDGLLDLLLVSADQDKKQTNLQYFFRKKASPFFGKTDDQPDVTTLINTGVQPFILDALGDRRADLMYVENGMRKLQQWNDDGTYAISNFSSFISKDPTCIKDQSKWNNQFAAPHSNAFVDFNGDCAADILITSIDPSDSKLVIEIWLRNPIDKLFCLVSYEKLDSSSISMISTADMDNNGRIDVVYADIPSDGSKPMNLHVIYNQFPVNYKKPCEAQLLTMVSPFGKDAFRSKESIAKVKQISQVKTESSSNLRMVSSLPNQPPRIRIGDINIDGYADVLFVGSSSAKATSGNIILGINEDGVVKFDRNSLNSRNQAYHTVFLTADHFGGQSVPLSTYQVTSASFFDFDEYGKPGIWAVTTGKGTPTLAGLFNFVSSENFIVKTLGLNGFTAGGEISESLGGIYHGTSIECVITNLDGDSRIAKGVQLPQSAYNPLDLPYMFIGLGRTNNYIENFVMGIPNGYGDNVQTTKWTPLIPNSQLIVNPTIGKHWTLDVFVNPTSGTLYVVLATIAILLILGVIILYLHRKEKKEDENDRDVFMRIFA